MRESRDSGADRRGSLSLSLKIMTFRRRVENIREAGFNFQEAARRPLFLSLFFSSLLSIPVSLVDSSCARQPGRFIRFGTCREVAAAAAAAAASVAAPITGRAAATAVAATAAASSLLLLRPLYCLNGRRAAFCQSSAPVSQLIHGCCYTFAHSIHYTLPFVQQLFPCAFHATRKLLLRIVALKLAHLFVSLINERSDWPDR